MFATAPLERLLPRWHDFGRGLEEDELIELLRRVRPAWLKGAAEALAGRWGWGWALARRLVVEGLSRKPTTPEYVRGMLDPHAWWDERDKDLVAILLDGPDLLEDVWRLFELGGSGRTYLSDSWEQALVELSRRKKLPRARLLDASLDALERDFTQFHAGWFSRFHEALAPTIAERVARAERYARLLQSPIGPTVTFALAALGELATAGKLDVDPAALRPALLARAKKTALAALKLVSDRPGLAVVALGHEAKEVQAAALTALERHGADAAVRVALKEHARGVAASLRPRVAALLDEPTPVKTPAKGRPAPRRGQAPSVLDPALAIAPIADVDELLDRFAFVLETPDDPDELERVLDGLARLGADRGEAFEERAGPLQKRARKLAERDDRPVPWELARLAVTWIAGAPPEPPDTYPEEAFAFLAARLESIGRRVLEGRRQGLLSAPTHRGGFIAPRALVARVAAAKEVDPLDAVVALLRLAPEGRPEALRAAGRLRGELADALRHALGAKGVRVGSTASLWVAAARARAPGEDDAAVLKRHPRLGPGAGEAARYSLDLRRDRIVIGVQPAAAKATPLALLTVRLQPLDGDRPCVRDAPPDSAVRGVEADVRWAFTLWPGWKEPLFAEGARRVAERLRDTAIVPTDRHFLEPLVAPTTRLGPMATLLLALGLAARDAGQHGLAVDAAIEAIASGRLDLAALGETMASLLASGLVPPPRWARTLADVAVASPTHAAAVARLVQRALRGPVPRDVGALLEALHEALVEASAGLDDPEAVRYLQGVVGGKAGKAANALLGAAT